LIGVEDDPILVDREHLGNDLNVSGSGLAVHDVDYSYGELWHSESVPCSGNLL